jgi:hypothetical protein
MKQKAWLRTWMHPLIVGVMMGCIALSVAELVRLFAPDWNSLYFFLACVLAALEAHYVYRSIQARLVEGIDLWKLRLIEFASFFVLLKIGGYIGQPWADVAADIGYWFRFPIEIFDAKTLVALVLVLFSWFAATDTARDLERLNEPDEVYRQLRPPMHSLSRRFLVGGVVLLLVSGLTRIEIASLLDVERPSVPGVVLNVLVYFVLGLIMLGQVQFVTLCRNWRMQKIEISNELAGRWVRYSLAFIALAAALAFLLPTGYTMGLLDLAASLLSLVLQVLNVIAFVILALISLPLMLIARLFGRSSPVTPPLQTAPLPPPQPDTAWSAPDWLGLLRSLLFWGVALGVLAYAVRTYLRDHPEVWEALMSFAPVRALVRLWAALRGRVKRWTGDVRERWARRALRRRLRAALTNTSLFSRSRARTPREWLLYYYLNIVGRADKVGMGRQPFQTPYEYGAELKSRLPEAEQEVGVLTEAFVEARYTSHGVESGLVERARSGWERIKGVLQERAREAREREARALPSRARGARRRRGRRRD